MAPKHLSLLLITIAAVSSASVVAAVSIGVKYGTLADISHPHPKSPPSSSPAPSSTASSSFDCNPDFICAFASTGILVSITAPNGAIPSLATPVGASSWIQSNVLPFLPATNIILVFVGNELMATADRNLIAHLVPAMHSVKSALSSIGHPQIRVSALHFLGILSASEPPSSIRFRHS